MFKLIWCLVFHILFGKTVISYTFIVTTKSQLIQNLFLSYGLYYKNVLKFVRDFTPIFINCIIDRIGYETDSLKLV